MLYPFLILAFLLFLFLVGCRINLVRQTKPFIIKQKKKTTYRKAIVFGAGLNRNLLPTKVLRDRLDKTIQLVQAGQLDRILLSGGKAKKISEPKAMYSYLVERGINPNLLILDEEGISTFDTLKRAKQYFQLNQLLLITQKFHLPRAIGIAQQLDMDVIGIAADTKSFKINSIVWWYFRELFAWIWSLIKIRTRMGT